jgi:GT2 family glycosyltransferase/nucleoside-diphosphate-sugar epimerase
MPALGHCPRTHYSAFRQGLDGFGDILNRVTADAQQRAFHTTSVQRDDVPSKTLTSVIIVNFNCGPLLTECVRSALSSTVPVEIIVVDNLSGDDSLELLRKIIGSDPRVRIVENDRNSGFAAACNLGLSCARGNSILFLNPDCLIKHDTIERMHAAMVARPGVGISGCLIRNPDGSEQPGCRRYMPTPWRSLVRVLQLSKVFVEQPRFGSFVLVGQPLPSQPTPVEAISGAFMFARLDAIKKVGQLDEGYFMHCEDLDWCMRFRDAGYEILFVPDVEVVHAKGTSSADRPIRVEYYKHRGMIRFYRKFFRQQYPTILMIAVSIAVWFRFIVKVAYLELGHSPRRAPFRISAHPEVLLVPSIPHPSVPERPGIIVAGASSQIGRFLIPRLRASGYRVHALSRQGVAATGVIEMFVTWHQVDIEHSPQSVSVEGAGTFIHLAPLAALVPMLESLSKNGIRRIIAFSSTSRFTKLRSGDQGERELVRTLINAEETLATKCAELGIAWTIFRPTLIYGCASDRNVTTIANFVRRFGFFPAVGSATGKRQPVHADDLAQACVAAIDSAATLGQAYNLSGGDTLTYREMVEAIFRATGRRARVVRVPIYLFRAMVKLAIFSRQYRKLNFEMANRMNADLCFDHSAATRDFGYQPRGFDLTGGAL